MAAAADLAAAGGAAEPRALHEVVDRAARRDPSAPAAVDEAGALSYGDLAASAAALAAALLRGGLAPLSERPLATCLARRRTWLVAYVAAMRCGSPLLALSADLSDAAAEAARNRGALRDLGAQLLLLRRVEGLAAATAAADEARQLRVRIADVDDLMAADLASPVAWPDVREDALLAYCFTGGTTRAARAARVRHAMALHEVQGYREVLPEELSGRSMRFLQNSSAYWGAAVLGQVDVALATGGAVVMCEASSPEEVAAAVRRFGVTCFGAVPSVLAHLRPEDVPRVRCVISWAEELPEGVAARWRGVPLRDLLIATEYWLALYSTRLAGRSLRPVRGVEVLVASPETLAMAGEGEVGEMLLAGGTVSPGYADASQDEGRFVDVGGRSYFRTRDLVRWVEAGARLEYCGRCDDMVKVGGRWVDVTELEARLAAAPGVAEAKLLFAFGGHHAFVALERPAAPPAAGAREGCQPDDLRRELPAGFAVHLVAGGRLPRHAATGKVDRHALLRAAEPAPEDASLSARRARVLRRLGRAARCAALFCGLDARRMLCLAFLWYAVLLVPKYGKLEAVLAKDLGTPAALLAMARALPLAQLRRLAQPGAAHARAAGRGLDWAVTFWLGVPYWLQPPGRAARAVAVPEAARAAVAELQALGAVEARRTCSACGAHSVTAYPSLDFCCAACGRSAGAEHGADCLRRPARRRCAGCGMAATWHPTHCCFACEKWPGRHGPRCDRTPHDAAADGDAAAAPHDAAAEGDAEGEAAGTPRAAAADSDAAGVPQEAESYAPMCADGDRADAPASAGCLASSDDGLAILLAAGAPDAATDGATGVPPESDAGDGMPAREGEPEASALPSAAQAPHDAGAEDSCACEARDEHGGALGGVDAGALRAILERVTGTAMDVDGGALAPLDSLRTLRLVAAVQQELGRTIGIQDVADCGSFADLVASVARAPRGDARWQRSPKRFKLWTFGWHQCLQWLFSSTVPLDADRLRAALPRLLERHPALRARCEERGDTQVRFMEAAAVLELLRRAPAATAAAPSLRPVIEAAQAALAAGWPRWYTTRASEWLASRVLSEAECPLAEVGKTVRDYRWHFSPPFQLVLLRHPPGEGACHLLVMMSHSIGDGSAVLPFVQDLGEHLTQECPRERRSPHFGAILEDRLLRTLAGDRSSEDYMYLDRRMDFFEHHFPEADLAGYTQVFHVMPSELERLLTALPPRTPPELALLGMLVVSLARLHDESVVKFTLVHHARDFPPGAADVVGFFTDFRTLEVPTPGLLSILGVLTSVAAMVRERRWRPPEILETIDTLVNVVPSPFDGFGCLTQARCLGAAPGRYGAWPGDGSLWQGGRQQTQRRRLEFQMEQVGRREWSVSMYLAVARYPPEEGRRFRELWLQALEELREDPLHSVAPAAEVAEAADATDAGPQAVQAACADDHATASAPGSEDWLRFPCAVS